MTPTMVAEGIGEPLAALDLLPGWERAMKRKPRGLWPAVDPRLIRERREDCGLSEDADASLLAVAERIASDQCLSALAWYLQWCVFDEPGGDRLHNLPALDRALGPLAGAFYLLLSLEFAPALRKAHRAAGYPEEVTRQTIAEVACFDGNHRRGSGRPGVYGHQYRWFRTYLLGPYVRLGRFEYQLGASPQNVRAWRRRDGAMVMLASDGQRFDSEGLATSGEECWTATLRYDEGCFAGFPILPEGRALRNEVRLPASEWTPFLAPGVDVLHLHIPAGGNMSFDACRDSFAEASRFFSSHHADRRPAAVLCTTWFLDPRLPQVLPGSNPARFQSALYCYPAPASGDGGLWFVFLDAVKEPPEKLPRDSSLRRALADFLATGGKWKGGSMLVPFDEAGDIRENRYREGFERIRGELGI